VATGLRRPKRIDVPLKTRNGHPTQPANSHRFDCSVFDEPEHHCSSYPQSRSSILDLQQDHEFSVSASFADQLFAVHLAQLQCYG
jgi:hypothetical protein